MKIEGGCHCGYIAYEAEADPATARICHCTDCQSLSGSAFRTVLPTREGSFKLRSGEFSAYFIYLQLGYIQAICSYCIISAIVSFLLLLAALWHFQVIRSKKNFE
jgi:hypothetical protein